MYGSGRSIPVIYGYIRVSTDRQTVENQRFEINKYCRRNKIKVDSWIEETISGTKMPAKRKLGKLIDTVQQGDTIIMTEISRLGRSLIMIMDTLQVLLEKRIHVMAIKEGYDLDDNIQSKVLAFAFGLSAEIERNLISDRTKQALRRKMAEGVHIGRYPGQRPKKYKLSGKNEYIRSLRHVGRSKLSIAKELGVTWVTLNTYMQRHRIA